MFSVREAILEFRPRPQKYWAGEYSRLVQVSQLAGARHQLVAGTWRRGSVGGLRPGLPDGLQVSGAENKV